MSHRRAPPAPQDILRTTIALVVVPCSDGSAGARRLRPGFTQSSTAKDGEERKQVSAGTSRLLSLLAAVSCSHLCTYLSSGSYLTATFLVSSHAASPASPKTARLHGGLRPRANIQPGQTAPRDDTVREDRLRGNVRENAAAPKSDVIG